MTLGSNKTLGEIIKETMNERHINGSAVAREMGVNRQTINKIDARKTFDIEFLQKFKEASGLDFTNYVFNPKQSKYEPIEAIASHFSEPVETYVLENDRPITIEIKVTAGITTIGLHLADILKVLQKEADKYGIKIE